jgi:hypothetical protein
VREERTDIHYRSNANGGGGRGGIKVGCICWGGGGGVKVGCIGWDA